MDTNLTAKNFITKKASVIFLTDRQKQVLGRIVATKKIEHRYHQRASIIIGADQGQSNSHLGRYLGMRHETVQHWRDKWLQNQEKLQKLDEEKEEKKYLSSLLKILSDEQRPGTPSKFTAEQVCQIIAVSCEPPESSGYPVSHWSLPLLSQEVVKRGIVDSISVAQVGRFLKSKGSKTS